MAPVAGGGGGDAPPAPCPGRPPPDPDRVAQGLAGEGGKAGMGFERTFAVSGGDRYRVIWTPKPSAQP